MGNRTVLVIEDNELNLKLIKELLNINKCNVLEAKDADVGIQMAQKHLPDLILMDIQLPGMDGLSATRILKSDSVLKDIPVIAITAHAMQGDEEKTLMAGSDGYISKPIDIKNFANYVNRFLASDGNGIEETEIRSPDSILIVDDEPLNIKLLQAILSPEGYEIMTALSGEQALEKVNAKSPDLILLDIMMPSMDGFEVTRRLKANAKTRDISIILITAYDITDYKVIGQEAGADEFLNKPVEALELKSRVKSLLRIKEIRKKLEAQRKTAMVKAGVDQEMHRKYEQDSASLFLVLDDENDANLIRVYLRGQPYKVVTEKTAEKAIAKSDQERIDLMLLDVVSGGKDCFEHCRRLKEKDQTASTQILIITDSDNLKDKHRQFELWSDDFLIKPINVNELRARIAALLKKKIYLDRLYAGGNGSVHSAITDRLTGLANHNFFIYFLEREIKRSLRNSQPLALIMMEPTNAKQHTNCLGHPAGEKILKELGGIIADNIREVDLGVRCKERKFAVVLPSTDHKGALMVAERLKAKIQKHAWVDPAKDPDGSPSFKFGIAVYPSDVNSMELLIQKAEKALI